MTDLHIGGWRRAWLMTVRKGRRSSNLFIGNLCPSALYSKYMDGPVGIRTCNSKPFDKLEPHPAVLLLKGYLQPHCDPRSLLFNCRVIGRRHFLCTLRCIDTISVTDRRTFSKMAPGRVLVIAGSDSSGGAYVYEPSLFAMAKPVLQLT